MLFVSNLLLVEFIVKQNRNNISQRQIDSDPCIEMSRVITMYCYNCFKIKKKIVMYLYLIFVAIPMAKGAIPGTFFWKPRLGLDLSIPTTEFTMKVAQPTKENIEEGIVVLMDGYNAGMTVISLAAGASSAEHTPHFNPMSGFFYTNVYRWALRYISLIPFWMGGSGGNYCDTHRVWRRRYYYMDEFVPSWLKTAIFWVDKEDWEKEELDYKRFKKFAEPAFGKYYRYPSKVFNDFKSHETVETMDQPASSSLSV